MSLSWPANVRVALPVRVSHILAVASQLPVTNEHGSERERSRWRGNVLSLSHLPVTNEHGSFGLSETDMTSPPWSEKLAWLSPRSTSHRMHVESPLAVTILLSSTKRQHER